MRFTLVFLIGCAQAGNDFEKDADGMTDASPSTSKDASPEIDAPPEVDAPPPELTTLSGIVYSGANDQPLSGATVEIDGYPFSSTTSSSTGTFFISVPENTDFVLRTTKTGFVGRQRPMNLKSSKAGLNITISPNSSWNSIASQLGLPNPNLSKGIIVVDYVGKQGGEQVVTQASHGAFYTINGSGNWLLSNSVLQTGLPFLIANDVETGNHTFTFTAPGARTCNQTYGVTSIPVDSNFATTIEVTCQ